MAIPYPQEGPDGEQGAEVPHRMGCIIITVIEKVADKSTRQQDDDPSQVKVLDGQRPPIPLQEDREHEVEARKGNSKIHDIQNDNQHGKDHHQKEDVAVEDEEVGDPQKEDGANDNQSLCCYMVCKVPLCRAYHLKSNVYLSNRKRKGRSVSPRSTRPATPSGGT